MLNNLLPSTVVMIFVAMLDPLVADDQVPSTSKSAPKQLTEQDQAALPPAIRALIPLHKPLGKPRPGEWLDKHEEAGQTYSQYLAARPVRATTERRTLWIQPLGDFTAAERKIVQLTAEYLGIYFQLPVKMSDDLPLMVVPEEARRVQRGNPQILSTYVLDKVLKPRLPKDAVASIAFTASDLWAGEGWNFVFGQASLGDRVGVWSLNRFGDPSQNDEAFRLALRRTLKTAAHETGHMFSLPHCVHFECVMNGGNSLEESDRQPLWLCPQCLAKVCYATGADPKKHCGQLAGFARNHKMSTEQEFWGKSLTTLESKAATGR